jgi:hypothetical protein
MVSPSRRRDAVTYLCRRHRVSERRACKVIGQHRSTQRYRAIRPEFEARLVERMNELAAVLRAMAIVASMRCCARRVCREP